MLELHGISLNTADLSKFISQHEKKGGFISYKDAL